MDPVTEERIKFTNHLVDKYREKFRAMNEKYRGDTESVHGYGDDLLAELLTELGYGDIVAIWKKLPKWYA